MQCVDLFEAAAAAVLTVTVAVVLLEAACEVVVANVDGDLKLFS